VPRLVRDEDTGGQATEGCRRWPAPAWRERNRKAWRLPMWTCLPGRAAAR